MINSINSNLNYNYTNSNSNHKQENKDIVFKTNKHGVSFITGEGALPYRGKKFEYNPKIFGLDESVGVKEMKDFNTFMKENQLKDPNKIEKSPFKNIIPERKKWDPIDQDIKLLIFTSYAIMYHLGSDIVKKAGDFRDEFNKLLKEDLSLDEFKNKYMDFKKRHDEFVKEYEIAMGDKMLIHDDIADSTATQENFKPIQGKSKNTQTYKDDNIKTELLKKLLENKFNLGKELEILFGVKIDDKDVNNNDFTKIFSKLNLHNIKSVDLKA